MVPNICVIRELALFAIAIAVLGGTPFTEVSQAVGALHDAAICVLAHRALSREDRVDKVQLCSEPLALRLVRIPMFFLALTVAVCDASTAAAARELLGFDISRLLAFRVSAVL